MARILFIGSFCKFDGASHDYSEGVFTLLVEERVQKRTEKNVEKEQGKD